MRSLLSATLLATFAFGCSVDRVTTDDVDEPTPEEHDDGEAEDGEEGAACRTALDCNEGLRCRLESPNDGACFLPTDEELDNRTMKFGPAGQPPPPYFIRGVRR